ncbi:MAG TPA: FAD-dependent oxidoreductase, partial [Crenalkalicoccus sp.]|nr:FAD-dependent oxidoreductase [Crenalkalicoccus sp.]
MTVHVIGGGVAGLAAALALADAGRPVTLHEAAPAA